MVKIVLFSILFGIFIFVIGLADIVAGSASSTLGGRKISRAFAASDPSGIVVGDILLDDRFYEDVYNMFDGYGADISDLEEDTTIGEFVEMLARLESFDERDIDEILEETDIIEFIAEVISAYEEYLYSGVDREVLTVKSVMRLIEDSGDEIEDIFDGVIRIHYDDIEEELKANRAAIEDINPSEAIPGVPAITAVACMPIVVIGAAVLVLGFAALIAVITKSLAAAFMTLGICSVLSGGAVLVAVMIKSVFIDMFDVGFHAVNNYLMGILDASLLGDLMLFGSIAAGVGLVCIITAVVLINVSAARERKRARAAA